MSEEFEPVDPAAVDAMLEEIVPTRVYSQPAPGEVRRFPEASPMLALRRAANLAVERINKMTVEQAAILASSPSHMQKFDEIIEALSQGKDRLKKNAAQLILARQKLANTLMLGTMAENVRLVAAQSEGGESRGGDGLSPEQAIRMLSDGGRLTQTETKTQRTVEAEAG